MNQLADEVLLKVFSFVPPKDLMTTISQVCRRWKDVAEDPSLFKTLYLGSFAPDTVTSIRLLRTASWLTSVTLSGRTDTEDIIPHIGVNHPRLVKLVIHKCRGSWFNEELSEMQLRNLVVRCSTLQEFYLLETPFHSQELLTEIEVNLPHNLRVLEVSESLKFDSKALVTITNHCYRIERIHLECVGSEPKVSSNAIAYFCEKFKESLTSFFLHTAWTNESLASMSRCRNVKELVLSHFSDISDEGIMLLCQMPKLESLAFSDVGNITSMGWVRLFKNPSMMGLVELTAHIQNLENLVISAISLLPNLTDLEICGGDITDEGLLSLSNSSNLARLTICFSAKVTSLGWIRFFQRSNSQKKMTHLRLLYCENVNDEVIKVIAQNLQNLQQREICR